MAQQFAIYSDDERERLRQALAAHKEHYNLSPQTISDEIAKRTGFPMTIDGGRKRVDRFIKGTHRQPDDFIDAIARYLGQLPPPDIEQSAAGLAHFFARSYRRANKITDLIGRYQAYLRQGPRTDWNCAPDQQVNVIDEFGVTPLPPEPVKFEIAYAVIELKPLQKLDALLVTERMVNSSADPKIDSFPAELPRAVDSGVIVALGRVEAKKQRFLMATRSVMETRIYNLFQAESDPLTLRGELTFNGGLGRARTAWHPDPLYPDYEIEMVRVSNA